jgi:hypothetical protein
MHCPGVGFVPRENRLVVRIAVLSIQDTPFAVVQVSAGKILPMLQTLLTSCSRSYRFSGVAVRATEACSLFSAASLRQRATHHWRTKHVREKRRQIRAVDCCRPRPGVVCGLHFGEQFCIRKITRLTVHHAAPNHVIVRMTSVIAQAQRPSCHHSWFDRHYVFDISTNEGRAMLSLLTSAYLAGKTAIVWGGSTCSNVGGDIIETATSVDLG